MGCTGFDIPNLILNLISVWILWFTWKCVGKLSRYMKWWEKNFILPTETRPDGT